MSWPLWERLYALALTLLLSALVVGPAFRNPPYDSFPFSDYPMFSAGRPTPQLRLTHVQGVFENGSRTPLSPWVAAGNHEVLQAGNLIRHASFGSVESRGAFCRRAAARVAEEEDLQGVVAVELVTSDFDCVRYFEEAQKPQFQRTHERCSVTRDSAR
ncbi:MAG: hypothetical protein AAF355_14035 [Myxococcota bacterium]